MVKWSNDEHGLCEVDLILSFVQKDNSTKNITVPAANKNFQDCIFTMDAIEVVYKTVIYLKVGTNRTRMQISNDNDKVYTSSTAFLIVSTTTASSASSASTSPTTSKRILSVEKFSVGCELKFLYFISDYDISAK